MKKIVVRVLEMVANSPEFDYRYKSPIDGIQLCMK